MRVFIETLHSRFDEISKRSREIVSVIDAADLYRIVHAGGNEYSRLSCGEMILRSAASIEQAFGGITTRLWDDPFEWTLPEAYPEAADMIRYLDEVDDLVKNGMRFFNDDTDLAKSIPAPVELRSIFEILLDAAAKAENYQGRAAAILLSLNDKKISRL